MLRLSGLCDSTLLQTMTPPRALTEFKGSPQLLFLHPIFITYLLEEKGHHERREYRMSSELPIWI